MNIIIPMAGMGKRMRRGMRGPLTIQEAEARAMQRFERIDSDDKGYITLNDIKAFRADRRERRRNREHLRQCLESCHVHVKRSCSWCSMPSRVNQHYGIFVLKRVSGRP